MQPPTPTLPAGPLARIRAYLRGDFLILRWVFLGLYLALIAGITAVLLADADFEGVLLTLVALGVMVAGQLLLIFGAGTIHLCRPVRGPRLLLPVFVAATMLTILVAGLTLALGELLDPEGDDAFVLLFWLLVPASWLFWGILLYAHGRPWPRHRVLARFATTVFGGSLLQLLLTVPSHLVVRRRPGCLVGIFTMMGIVAGVYVMLFSFGPMIAVLMLRPRLRRERQTEPPVCESCGYDLRASRDRCPECGTPFTAPANRP